MNDLHTSYLQEMHCVHRIVGVLGVQPIQRSIFENPLNKELKELKEELFDKAVPERQESRLCVVLL